jgi:DNA-binding response OmpR family regulator
VIDKKRLVVLVVEDHVDTRDLYVAVLEQAGFMTLAAGSVAEARGMLDRMHIDVLVADYWLPDGTGAELTKLCTDAKPKVCVLVTGHGTDDIDATGYHVKLRKPLNGDDLVAAIRAHL